MKEKIKIAAIIQARMTSTRLPGKVLKLVCKKPMLSHIVERLKFSKFINQIILAIPDTKENDILEEFALQNSLKYYRGSEEDVLSRFYFAAKENNSEVIVRITGDNPLIDHDIIDEAIKSHLDKKADYSWTRAPERFLPLGLDVEVFNFQTLKKIHEDAKENWHREHVTPYLYENPDIFKINNVALLASLENPHLRLTVDTKEDLELINKIYKKLYRPGGIFKTKEIINFLEEQPELKKINASIIQRTRNLC